VSIHSSVDDVILLRCSLDDVVDLQRLMDGLHLSDVIEDVVVDGHTLMLGEEAFIKVDKDGLHVDSLS
jgi:hypothetical protein